MTNMLLIAPEPQILVSLEVHAGEIFKVELSLSDAFYFKAVDHEHSAFLEWLAQYAQRKEPSTFVPLSLDNPESFSSRALEQLKKVTFGKRTHYQSLAKSLGKPKGARAIGNACASNPFPLFIPCHRVLQKNGSLGGFSCGLEIKKRLLAFENLK